MFSSLVEAIGRNDKLRDPKSYEIGFIHKGTLMGDLVGEGWYIVAMNGPTVGPVPSRQEAEHLLMGALEQAEGRPFSEAEKATRRASWIK